MEGSVKKESLCIGLDGSMISLEPRGIKGRGTILVVTTFVWILHVRLTF